MFFEILMICSLKLKNVYQKEKFQIDDDEIKIS